MTVQLEQPPAPEAFRAAAATLFAALAEAARPGLALREVPAPRKLAPYSVAVAADVSRGGEEVASGRFVVLHDPAGQDGWRGDTRIVAFVSADVEAEMAADSALAAVGWSWLTESLTDRGALHTAAGGTVTRTMSSRFGSLEQPDESNEVEIRASWTALAQPDGTLDLGEHLRAWCDLLCATAGLPPPGVSALPHR
ncbi:MAG: hypothetical protein QOE99_2802 [Actinomycetota bacterium]|nr:hypothetical protein [Actinomycetota bacterium]